MTADLFFEAYKNGQRHFSGLDFEDLEGFTNKDFRDIVFEKCFLYLDCRHTNFTNAKFINCNLKCIDLRYADLTNAFMTNCLLENAMFKGAKVDKFIFADNYCYGGTFSQKDFANHFADTDSYILSKKRVSEIDFLATLSPAVRDVTWSVEMKINIWPFVKELVYENIIDEKTLNEKNVIKIYRNKLDWCDHVLIPGKNGNPVTILVDLENRNVLGFYQPGSGNMYYR